MRRLNDETQCNETSYAWCNNSTCYVTPSLNCSSNNCNSTDIVCTSYCSTDIQGCNSALLCSDGEMILTSQFCNDITDCLDGSDEFRYQPGFKCEQSIGSCVLPQRNLHDTVGHCADHSDLCHANGSVCFECLDKRLFVSTKQVCDGVIDCYDLSDECLCENNLFYSPLCSSMFKTDPNPSNKFCEHDGKLNLFDISVFKTNPQLVQALFPENDVSSEAFFNPNSVNLTGVSTYCQTKDGHSYAIPCDGRPTCRDFSDECNCLNPPPFCNDSCRLHYNSFYPFGDRYCDGIEDEFAWKYLDPIACAPGFDEKLCPKRFYCKSGDQANIDVTQICNRFVDCDEGEDEQNCSVTSNQKLFSSDTQMIDNAFFLIAFWLNGSVISIACVIVIVKKTNYLKTANLTNSLRCQHLIILNISFADFIMGLYLLIIAVHSSIYSGYYGKVDLDWRSSWRCSIIGSFAVISSEASCLLMLVLTAFRLHSVCDPFATLSTRMWPWKIGICTAWFTALIVGTLPILSHSGYLLYFLHNAYFAIGFNKQGLWNTSSLTKIACRFAALTNKTINDVGNEWISTKKFLEENFPNKTILEFGYYSETSVCMPRFFVASGETAWEYTFAIMTLNFLAFMTIAVCYISLFYESRRLSEKSRENNKQKSSSKEAKMKKRIATLIATDFLCWIPICVMCYVKMNGGEFSNIVYEITAVFFLPINSVLNPFIYSLIPEAVLTKKPLCCRK